ncbi:hypothetical protein VUR80DRAFT_10204 [Thermomyces stellatus]
MTGTHSFLPKTALASREWPALDKIFLCRRPARLPSRVFNPRYEQHRKAHIEHPRAPGDHDWGIPTCYLYSSKPRTTRSLPVILGVLALPASECQGPSSEEYFPSPWATGGTGWDEAVEQARDFVAQLTLAEKVNLTTGTDWEADQCVGVTGSVPRLGFRGFCLQDGPLGVRFREQPAVSVPVHPLRGAELARKTAHKTSAFPSGLNAATTFSRKLIRQRGSAIGAEFYGKGVDVALGPLVGPLGFFPPAGATGRASGPTREGVVACVKHYILNEQEHYRGSISAELDDGVMEEVFQLAVRGRS